MKTTGLPHVLVLFVVLSISLSCCIMGKNTVKNPVMKGTKWTATQQMFVADAGTMTIIHTLEFTSDKDVMARQRGSMPPYPAMYMNPDGTVDTLPGHSFEYDEPSTYAFRDGKLILTRNEGGGETEYTFQPDGTLTRVESWGETLVFSQVKEDGIK